MDTIVQQLDREIDAAEKEILVLSGRVRSLKGARKLLSTSSNGTVKRARRTRNGTAAVPASSRAKAGPAAIDRVQKALEVDLHGRASQAALRKATGLNSGQVSAAVRHLEEAGVFVRTEEKEGKSHVFEYKASAA